MARPCPPRFRAWCPRHQLPRLPRPRLPLLLLLCESLFERRLPALALPACHVRWRSAAHHRRLDRSPLGRRLGLRCREHERKLQLFVLQIRARAASAEAASAAAATAGRPGTVRARRGDERQLSVRDECLRSLREDNLA